MAPRSKRSKRTRQRFKALQFERMRKASLLTLVFLPGVCFIGLGFLVVLAPHLVLGLMSLMCVVFGILCCLLAAKFLQLRQKFHQLTQRLEAHIFIQPRKGSTLRPGDEGSESKKIVYH